MPSHLLAHNHSTQAQAQQETKCEPGMLNPGALQVPEDTHKGRGCGLGRDFGWGRNDLGNGFEDRGARGNDGITGYGFVPVAAVLYFSVSFLRTCWICSKT